MELVLELTDIIMQNKYFQFGNTNWIQVIGNAMGTPMAFIYAKLYFAWKEEHDIVPRFKHNLPFYRRSIDDVLGVWIPGNGRTYNELCLEMNNFGPNILKWIPSKLSTKVTMLDLAI